MTDRINVALVGSKFMGRAHSNAWLKVGKFFNLAQQPAMHTVVGRNASELSEFATQWGWQNATTDWRAAITSDDIELVDIATPNSVHAEQAIAALEAGKHVACEKPLAGTLDDARAMTEAALTAQGQTFVWFNYRRVPAVALAHELVQSGALGQIYHARAVYLQSWGGPDTPLLWRFQSDVAGSGAHGDLNAHIIDAVRFITGEEITTVEGAIEKTFIKERDLVDQDTKGKGTSTVDDAVMFLARLSGGGIASFEATRLATGYHNANRFEIHGEHGAIRFNLERMNELDYYDARAEGKTAGWATINVTRAGDNHPYAEAWWPDSHIIGYEHGFINQAADILSMISGGKPRVPMPDFADAFKTQGVLHAAVLSAREHTPISLDSVL